MPMPWPSLPKIDLFGQGYGTFHKYCVPSVDHIVDYLTGLCPGFLICKIVIITCILPASLVVQ